MPYLSPYGRFFFLRWQAHVSPADAALEFALSVRTVRRLFARFAQLGPDGIDPDYRRCGQDQPKRTPNDQIERLCQTRRDHPGWGSEMIRLAAEEQSPTPPCARTIRRHLRQAGLQPAPAGRPAAQTPGVPRATQPHEGWQVDASEELVLRTGQRVCWLRVVDECSGAFLHTQVFPQPRWEHVDRHAIQDGLRGVFSRWGLPARLRVDNGYPWGSSADLPPEMALWLYGLGIDMVWIAPGCPQHNGVVERAQQTGQDWFEPQTCSDAAELQRRADALDQQQRERYPYRQGQSRWQVYPELRHSGRSYRPLREARQWQARRVWSALSVRVVRRRVDKTGSVSIYRYSRYVGKAYIGSEVYVSLDPSGPTWVIADGSGTQLRTHAAAELSQERIRGLAVGCRKGKQRRK